MLTSGDVIDLDLGTPHGRESGFRRPAVVVTANTVLESSPAVIHVAPATTTVRGHATEVAIEPDSDNGLTEATSIQCVHVRSISADRVEAVRGNVGPAALSEIRSIIGLLLDIS